jgi:hypothetical protein
MNFIFPMKKYFPQNLPMERALSGKQQWYWLYFITAVSREKKRVLINGDPLLDQDNNVIAAVVTLRDIKIQTIRGN